MTYFGENNIPFFLLLSRLARLASALLARIYSFWHFIWASNSVSICTFAVVDVEQSSPLTHTTHIAAHLCLDLFLFFSLLHGSSIGIPFSILCFIYILIYCFFCFQCVVELCMDTNRGMWRVACRVIAYHKRFCNQELAETMSAKARLWDFFSSTNSSSAECLYSKQIVIGDLHCTSAECMFVRWCNQHLVNIHSSFCPLMTNTRIVLIELRLNWELMTMSKSKFIVR